MKTRVFLVKVPQWTSSFFAICLFGFIFAVRPLDSREMNHERIHAAQQKELFYIPFYIWYALEWLVLLGKYRNALKAYSHIRFEEEAYRHEGDMQYLEHRRHYRYR